MRTTEQADIGTEQGPCTYRDETGVEDAAVVIDEDSLSHTNVGAVVDANGSFYPRFILEQCFILDWVVQLWREWCLVTDDAGMRCQLLIKKKDTETSDS